MKEVDGMIKVKHENIAGLCGTCRTGLVVEGNGTCVIECLAAQHFAPTFPVESCTRYDDKRLPSRRYDGTDTSELRKPWPIN